MTMPTIFVMYNGMNDRNPIVALKEHLKPLQDTTGYSHTDYLTSLAPSGYSVMINGKTVLYEDLVSLTMPYCYVPLATV